MDSRAPRPNDPRWPAIHVRAERNEYRPLEVQLLVWSPAYRRRFAAPMSFCSQYPTCGQIQAISTSKLSEEGMSALSPNVLQNVAIAAAGSAFEFFVILCSF